MEANIRQRLLQLKEHQKHLNNFSSNFYVPFSAFVELVPDKLVSRFCSLGLDSFFLHADLLIISKQ